MLSIIKKIKTQAFLRKVIVAHFIQRKKLNIYFGRTKIFDLPDWKLIAKKKARRQMLARVISKVSSEELKQKNLIFATFREEMHTYQKKSKEDEMNKLLNDANKKAILEKIGKLVSGSTN